MARGSKPGERRGGRSPGVPNKVNREIKEIARQYGPAAIERAAKLAGLLNEGEGRAESEAAQIAAMNIVLERGYGKAPQPMTGNEDGGPIKHTVEVSFVGAKSSGAAGSVPRTVDAK